MSNALTSLRDATAKREQTVLTPESILSPLLSAWTQVVYDPCSADGSLVGAMHTTQLPDDGLSYNWPDRTFVNPPYKHPVLRDFLLHDHIVEGARVAWLVPVRPHRHWWRTWARTLNAIIYLKPFPFVGHKGVFPAPMCLGYRGHDAEDVAWAYESAGLGETL